VIELNLLERKQSLKIPVIMGIDIKKISLPKMIIAILIYNIAPYYLVQYYQNALKDEEVVTEKLRKQNSKLELDIKSRGDGKKELESYTEQIQKSKLRSTQIDEILKTRSNPKKIMEVIARSIPEEVSFDNLNIDMDDNINISGESLDSRSVGNFISAINDTPYFGGSIVPIKQENKQSTVNGVVTSIDGFELKGKIKNYDMRSN
jgi:Tfp pilus assembly protein PilN